MNESEIISLWKQGISKNKLAQIYKRNYNNEVKLIRMTVRNRFEGKFISEYEALSRIENIIYKYLFTIKD